MSELAPKTAQGNRPAPRWTAAFDALRSRPFRWYWVARMSSLAAFQMDAVAQGWLVYELTGSALTLSWVSACRSIAMLLISPYGGLLSDRLERRSIMVWTRWLRLLAHLAIAVLTSLGAIQVWHLALHSLVAGVLIALSMPSDRAMVPDLVERRALLNAFAFSAVAMGMMGMLASWAAGLLIDATGVAVIYFVIVAFHLATGIVVSQLPKNLGARKVSRSMWLELSDLVRYVSRREALLTLLGLALATVVFGWPYRTLMPTFAKEVMGFGAAGLGLLTAAPQLGGLISALAMAALGRYQAKGKLLLAGGVLLGASILLFGNVRVLWLVLPLLALAGAMSNVCMVMTQTLLQVNVEDRFLGRVMSLQIMVYGLAPLGTLPAGAIADRVGVPAVVSALGALLIVTFAVTALRARIRQLA